MEDTTTKAADKVEGENLTKEGKERDETADNIIHRLLFILNLYNGLYIKTYVNRLLYSLYA